MESHYLQWHPDHQLFRWVRGRGLSEGNVFYFEEKIAGKLLRETVTFVHIVPNERIEFRPTFWLLRLFLPRMIFQIEPHTNGTYQLVAEIHLRIGPLAARLNKRELDDVREHMADRGHQPSEIVEHEGASAPAHSQESP